MNKISIGTIILLTLLLIVGCSPRIIEVDKPIYINQTIYKNNTIEVNRTVYLNNCTTVNQVSINDTAVEIRNVTYIYACNSSVVTALVQKIAWYESREEMYLNSTDENYKYRYETCNATLSAVQAALED